MAIQKWIVSALLAGAIPAMSVSASENMMGRQSQNEGMEVLPVVKPVVVDGNSDDWDTSGRIWVFADKSIRNRFSVEMSAMWDKDALYIGAKWKDPTPMYSTVDPAFNPSEGWKSDAIQFRLSSEDQSTWLTTWYFTPKKQPILHQFIWKDRSNERLGGETKMYVAEPGKTDLGNGIQMAYKADADGQGYFQEIRIPWGVIYAKPQQMGPGKSFRMGLEFLWGDATGNTWPIHRYADNMQAGVTTREFFWSAKDAWGDAKLVAKGNVPLRQYINDADTLTGPVRLRAEVPSDAVRFSLAIDDADGKRVRNIGGLDVADYTVETKGNTRVVEVPWDGLTDPYPVQSQKPAAKTITAGTYNVRGIYHTGLGAKYEMSFYNPGTPPWATVDGNGAWGADHASPLRVARAGENMIVSWSFAEGGSGIIGINKEGKKIWGEKRGALFLAADEKYVYAVPASWYIKEEVIVRLDSTTGKYAPFMLDGKERPFELTTREILGGKAAGVIIGIAASGDTLALSMSDGEIVLLDRNSAAVKKRLPVANVGRLAFSNDGKLYAAIGGTPQVDDQTTTIAEKATLNRVAGAICSVDLNTGATKVIATPGAAKIVDLSIDASGNILVLDAGPDSQVKAYSTEGKALYTCGQKGGRPIRGAFQPQAMMSMSSLAADAAGKVWVIENWDFPRRVSVWNQDGSLDHDYLGNTGYAGTGSYLHESDPTLGYVGPLEFKLDKKNRTWTLQQILWVPDASQGEGFTLPTGTHVLPQRFASSASGKERQYLFAPPYRGTDGYAIYMERDGKWAPVSAITSIGAISGRLAADGAVVAMPEGEFAGLDPFDGVFWNDKNTDGKVQRSECEIIPARKAAGKIGAKGGSPLPIGSGWGGRIDHQFKFYADGLFQYKPVGFSEDGAPIYSAKSLTELAIKDRGDLVPVDGENQLLCLSMTNYAGATLGLRGIDLASGEEKWSYPNPYPGVHGSHAATMPKAGLLIGPLKITGVAKANDDVGNIAHLRGNLGQDFFFTTDGIYVDSMFQDTRLPGMAMPKTEEELAKMPIEAFTQGGEPFNGWFGRQSDGKIRLTSGIAREACTILEVTGLESVRRLPVQSVVVNAQKIAEVQQFLQQKAIAQASSSERTYVISRVDKPMDIDAKLNDWGKLPLVKVQREGGAGSANVRLAYDAENLYAFFDVRDATPWANEGRDFSRLFKTGDTVDLQLSATGNKQQPKAGDVRVMISQLAGKPVVVVMQPIAATKGADAKVYHSPVQNRNFDRVAIIPAKVQVQKTGEAYMVEVAVPWSALGIVPKAGMKMTGDVGFTGSDTAGTTTISRTYWSNLETNLVNDEPTESWLYPQQWGTLTLGE